MTQEEKQKKALEAYPIEIRHATDSNRFHREGYIRGYDQAMQDFIEKAERWLEPTFKNIAGYNCGGDLMNDFKNYMEEEL